MYKKNRKEMDVFEKELGIEPYKLDILSRRYNRDEFIRELNRINSKILKAMDHEDAWMNDIIIQALALSKHYIIADFGE
jgi:hypothetical protein